MSIKRKGITKGEMVQALKHHEQSIQYLTNHILLIDDVVAKYIKMNNSQKDIFNFGVKKIDYVGNYAVRIHFDDMHDTGIYSWLYLYELGETKDTVWNSYLEELKRLGLKRKSNTTS